MKFFRTLLICLLIVGFILYKQGNEQVVTSVHSMADSLRSYSESITKRPEVSNIIAKLQEGYQSLKGELKEIETQEQVEIPSLKTPEEQTFSVHNIEIGDTKAEVEKQAGKAKRASYNEYGVKWYAYHENYQNFFMAAYDDQGKLPDYIQTRTWFHQKTELS